MVGDAVQITNAAGATTEIQSVARAVDVLLAFNADTPTLSPAEVANRVGMNRTTAWRYLATLAQTGLLQGNDDNPVRFSLGPRVLGLAEVLMRQWGGIVAAAQGPLAALRDATGETAALHIRQGHSRVVVTQAESRHELRRTYREIGEPIPLHLGAPGRAILSSLTDAEFRSYSRQLAAASPELDLDELHRDIKKSRRLGYSVSVGARVSGVASVAAPIPLPDHHYMASINITGPRSRVLDIGPAILSVPVIGAALDIARSLPTSSPKPVAPTQTVAG